MQQKNHRSISLLLFWKCFLLTCLPLWTLPTFLKIKKNVFYIYAFNCSSVSIPASTCRLCLYLDLVPAVELGTSACRRLEGPLWHLQLPPMWSRPSPSLSGMFLFAVLSSGDPFLACRLLEPMSMAAWIIYRDSALRPWRPHDILPRVELRRQIAFVVTCRRDAVCETSSVLHIPAVSVITVMVF